MPLQGHAKAPELHSCLLYATPTPTVCHFINKTKAISTKVAVLKIFLS